MCSNTWDFKLHFRAKDDSPAESERSRRLAEAKRVLRLGGVGGHWRGDGEVGAGAEAGGGGGGRPAGDESGPSLAEEQANLFRKLGDEALWYDVIKNICADESNHRDVNHTFAGMEGDDPNPYVQKHNQDAAKAWRTPEQLGH